MGLVFQDNYSFSQVSSFTVLETVRECITRIEKNQATAALTRWFGDSSPAFKTKLKKDLEKYRRIINLQNVKVGFRDLNERQVYDPTRARAPGRTGQGGFVSVVDGENAAALPGSLTSIDPGTGSNYKGRHVLLNEEFKTLPTYLPRTGAGLIDSSDYYQSKFNTLLHEISHVILNTNDELLNNGDEAYGAENAETLVGESTALAYTNAENWGIFIEACGYHKTS